MVRSCLLLLEIYLLLVSLNSTCICMESRNVIGDTSSNSSGSMVVPIGVVLNMMSPQGPMLSWCIKTAVSDFYAAHPNYKTRLELHTKNAENLLESNLAGMAPRSYILISARNLQLCLLTKRIMCW